MLNKNRSGKLARLKYLAALPLCAGMLCTSTLVFSKDFGLIDLAPRKEFKATADSRKDTVPGNINQLPPPPPSFRLKKPFQAFMTKKQSKTILAPPIVMPDNAPVPPPPPTSRPNKVPTPPPPPTVRPNKVPTPPTAMKPGNIKFPPPVVKPDKAPTPPVSSL